MNIQLVGGPDDGEIVTVPNPAPNELTIIVVRSDADAEYMNLARQLTGTLPPDDLAPVYLVDEYRLTARANTELIYLFQRETPHGRSVL